MTNEKMNKFMLPLDIQFFAGDDDPKPSDDNPQDPPSDGGKDDDKGGNPSDKKKEEVKFTEEQQEAINRIIQERLKREEEKRKKAEEEAKLKEQGKYKDLLEEKEKELERLKEEVKMKELDRIKTDLLIGAGYAQEQFEFVKKNLEGETEEELKASLEEVKQYIAPKKEPADPLSKGNGVKGTPKPSDNEEVGRELARKIKARRKR